MSSNVSTFCICSVVRIQIDHFLFEWFNWKKGLCITVHTRTLAIHSDSNVCLVNMSNSNDRNLTGDRMKLIRFCAFRKHFFFFGMEKNERGLRSIRLFTLVPGLGDSYSSMHFPSQWVVCQLLSGPARGWWQVRRWSSRTGANEWTDRRQTGRQRCSGSCPSVTSRSDVSWRWRPDPDKWRRSAA